MSGASVAPDRFWHEFKSDVAGSLTAEQRSEVDRVLSVFAAPAGTGPGDLRLSFKWFFVRLMWGAEKRSPDRIKHDLELHPVMTRRNAPVVASLFAGYMALTYIALALGMVGLAYLVR